MQNFQTMYEMRGGDKKNNKNVWNSNWDFWNPNSIFKLYKINRLLYTTTVAPLWISQWKSLPQTFRPQNVHSQWAKYNHSTVCNGIEPFLLTQPILEDLMGPVDTNRLPQYIPLNMLLADEVVTTIKKLIHCNVTIDTICKYGPCGIICHTRRTCCPYLHLMFP